MPTQQKEFDYNESPVAWFVVLEQARKQNDFERAAEAQRELQRLGVNVKYRKQTTTPGIQRAACVV